MSDELLELAARCEAASAPDRELDARIYCAVNGHKFPQPPYTASYFDEDSLSFESATSAGLMRQCRIDQSERYTASLDAAMTLVPDGWYGRVEPRFYSDDGEVRWRGYAIKPDWSRWTPHDDWFEVIGEEPTITASKPALALTAASLRARASRLRMEVE